MFAPLSVKVADIAAADRIVCVGRGLSKKEDLTMVEALAAAVGAEIGCTRGISEDYRWLPNDRYIGISGQKVKPELLYWAGHFRSGTACGRHPRRKSHCCR